MFTHAHLHPLSFSQFSQWLHPMFFTNVHRCFTYWMVSKSCTQRMLEHYITILNHYYPLHFLGTSSCPTQLVRFFGQKAWAQHGINRRGNYRPTSSRLRRPPPFGPDPRARRCCRKSPSQRPEREAANQAFLHTVYQIYQFWSGTSRPLFILLGCGMKEMWEPLLVMTRNSSCLSELCQLCSYVTIQVEYENSKKTIHQNPLVSRPRQRRFGRTGMMSCFDFLHGSPRISHRFPYEVRCASSLTDDMVPPCRKS